MKKNKDSKFESEQLLKVSVTKNGNYKSVIQVVKWGDNSPSLEKRNYYLKDGEWICGKTSGFNLKDFKKLLKNKSAIKEALSNSEEEEDEE